MLALEDYLAFVDSVSGMSDEEYVAMNKKVDEEKEASVDRIEINILENIKYAALEKDFEVVNSNMEELQKYEYEGEDKEFIEVLIEAVNGKSIETIDELITTYIDLKI